MKRKNKKQLTLLSISAAMAALSVVFTRFLGFSPEGTSFRFEIGFLPIAVAAYVAGPLYAMGAYLTADVIGSLFSGYAPNPWITLAQCTAGAIMGICFYKKHSLTRVIICFVAIAVISDILIKAPALAVMYSWTIGFAVGTKALNALLNLPLRIVLYYFTLKALKEPLEQII